MLQRQFRNHSKEMHLLRFKYFLLKINVYYYTPLQPLPCSGSVRVFRCCLGLIAD